MADVPDGSPRRVLGVLGGPRFFRVLVVVERHPVPLEIDDAVLACGHLVAGVVADAQLAEDGLADRAGPRQRLDAVDGGEATQLGATVVLRDDRAPPVDHLPLHLDGAWRRRMDGDLQARQVVARAHGRVQLEHADEHGRHPLAVGHAVAFDQAQRFLGIELLGKDGGAAAELRVDHVAQRRGVVDRRHGQADGVFVEVEARHRRCAPRVGPLGHQALVDGAHHTLGPAGGARAVHHRGAQPLFGQALRARAGYRVLVAVPARHRAVGHQQFLAGGQAPDHLGRQCAHGVARHDHPGIAVVEDVGRLVRRQVAVHRRHPEARTQCRPRHLHGAQVVVHQDGDVVATLQPQPTQVVRQLGGALVQLAVGDGRAGGRVDDGGLVRREGGVVAEVGESAHARSHSSNLMLAFWIRVR